eukprot:TRINITY_DN2556_c0_g1_i1.p1 TRINITY_DN2556_c0_g1~~TRINITY_DN2556_c0_g1_i1.p1  ORF type:complete len:295 (+),score=47.91 TRINITY_DN2556_c0_g1_i1:21-905(+)
MTLYTSTVVFLGLSLSLSLLYFYCSLSWSLTSLCNLQMGSPREPVFIETPCFFKVMIGDFSEKLRIPPAFIPNFHGKLIEESTLKCPNDEVWPVKMKHDAGKLFFDNGWQDFVKDKNLEVGDFLVFRYDGDSGFDVQIFGKSGCEKGGSLFYKKVRKCLRFTALCTCRFQIKSAESDEKNGKGKRKAVFDVKSCRFKLKHPHFTARWRQHKPYTVLIPKAFVRQYNLTKRVDWSFRNPSGELWPVKIVHSCNRSDFGAGWRDFRVGNKLTGGDNCIFEFLKDDIIQVHIIRAKE